MSYQSMNLRLKVLLSTSLNELHLTHKKIQMFIGTKRVN